TLSVVALAAPEAPEPPAAVAVPVEGLGPEPPLLEPPLPLLDSARAGEVVEAVAVGADGGNVAAVVDGGGTAAVAGVALLALAFAFAALLPPDLPPLFATSPSPASNSASAAAAAASAACVAT